MPSIQDTTLVMTINPCNAVIFDLDGTLLNTLTSLANCYNRALAAMNFPLHDTEAYRYFIGDGARQCVTRCLPENERSEQTISETLQKQQLDYRLHWQQDVERYPGITELLVQLNARGTPVAVLSNKDQVFTQQCVEHFFPEINFARVIGFSNEIPPKPDPRGALAIAQHLSIPPSQIALVGDTAMDMKAAVACQMTAVGALWGFRDEQELLLAGAKTLVSHPGQISSALGLDL